MPLSSEHRRHDGVWIIVVRLQEFNHLQHACAGHQLEIAAVEPCASHNLLETCVQPTCTLGNPVNSMVSKMADSGG